MFSSFGAQVTLVVSRQQVLPAKDPEVAAVLEEDFLSRGVKLLKGARAVAIERVPHVFPANGHNENYLRTKAERAGHML